MLPCFFNKCAHKWIHVTSIFGLWFSSGFEFSRGAYKAQEFIKGELFNLGNFVMIRGQAGWDKTETRYINRNMNDIENSELKIGPYFRKFREDGIMSVNRNIASSLAGQPRVKYDLLARGLPALSYAAGVTEISGLGVPNIEEYNMPERGRLNGQWPSEGHETETKEDQWLHSDFRDV